MIRLKTGVKIRHDEVTRVCAIEDKSAVVVVASYGSVSRNPDCFKALIIAMSRNHTLKVTTT